MPQHEAVAGPPQHEAAPDISTLWAVTPGFEPITAGQPADLAHKLKALAEPTRLRLVSMVAAHEGGEACVCELTEPLGLTQPTVSHYLKVLVDAGSSPATSAASGPTPRSSPPPWMQSPPC